MASDPPLNILVLTKSTGGLAQYNRTLSAGLHARGDRVHVVCLSENGAAYAGELQGAGIDASAVAMSRYRISPVSDFSAFRRTLALTRRLDPDVIVAHGAKAGFIGRLLGRVTRIPTVYAMHSLPFLERVQGRRASAYGALERLANAAFGGHIVALTESMKTQICTAGRIPPERVSVIYTGIDVAGCEPLERGAACRALGLDPERPVVGWSGRFSRQKAPERFSEIARRIVAQQPRVQFVMAGASADDLARWRDGSDASSQVTVRPWLDNPLELYSACDVYVLTSRWEGLPLSLLEAMAAGCPVVATRVDGVGEAVQNGVDGLLYDDGDVAGMTDGVAGLLGDGARRAELADAARRRVHDAFDEGAMIGHWHTLLRRQAARR